MLNDSRGVQEDVTLSVQGLDAAQRQSLEDALFELNLALAYEAVAKGLPLMQYMHPDATHVGMTTLPRYDGRARNQLLTFLTGSVVDMLPFIFIEGGQH